LRLCGSTRSNVLEACCISVEKIPGKGCNFQHDIRFIRETQEKLHGICDNAALFDYDFKEDEFGRNITICEQLQRKSRKEKGKNVYHAYSNVNIDLWFILHKENFNRPVTSNDAYVADVRRIYGLGQESDIKEKANLERMLKQITLEDVKQAIKRAEQIRAAKLESDRFMVGAVPCYGNPDFSLHEFLKIVLRDCGEL
jgi:hypothetical protein